MPVFRCLRKCFYLTGPVLPLTFRPLHARLLVLAVLHRVLPPGTRCGHFSEAMFEDELMTGFVNAVRSLCDVALPHDAIRTRPNKILWLKLHRVERCNGRRLPVLGIFAVLKAPADCTLVPPMSFGAADQISGFDASFQAYGSVSGRPRLRRKHGDGEWMLVTKVCWGHESSL